MRGKQNNENQLYGKFRKYTSSPNISSANDKDMSKTTTGIVNHGETINNGRRHEKNGYLTLISC